MKSFTRLFVSISVLAACVSAASAQDPVSGEFVIDGIRYYGSGTKASIIGYTEDVGSTVVIPWTVTYQGHNFHVGEIEANAFAGCTKMTELIFDDPDGKAMSLQIGDGAFNTPTLQRIITKRGRIPEVTGDPFSQETYDTGELIVSTQMTVEQQDAYRTTKPWSEFFDRNHGIVTGIDGVQTSGPVSFYAAGNTLEVTGPLTTDIEVYSLLGTLIYKGREANVSLPSGVYVLRANGSTVKFRL